MLKKFCGIVASTVVFVIVIVINQGGLVKAQTSLEYYKGLFSSWGIAVDTLPQKNIKLDTPATKKDLQTLVQMIENGETNQKLTEDGVVTTNKEGRYLLVLASQLQTTPQIKEGMLGYQSIILVCDSGEAAPLPPDMSCASNNLNFATQNPTESSVSAKILQTIQPVSTNGVKYYLLPQVLLITPQYQKYLGDYFKALSRAQVSAKVSDTVKTTDSTSRELLKTFKDSALFESTVYTFVILLFIVALHKPLVILVRNPKKLLERNLYANQMHRALNFLTKYSGIISFIFLILAIFYIPIFYALTIKAQLLGDPSYPLKYLSTTLNPLNIPNYLTSQNLFRVGLLFFHYILALFGLFLLIPALVGVTRKSTQKICVIKLRTTFIKWLLPVTIALNGLLLTLVDLKPLTGFLSLSIIIIFLALLYLKSSSINYSGLFTTKERNLVFLTMFVVLTLNFVYPLLQKSRPINYAYEPLIGIKDTVIALPYSKKWGKGVLFEPYYYSGTSNVYAGSYLIYSPNAEQVVNKSLIKFTATEGFAIVSRKADQVFEVLLKNQKLLKYLSTAEFSPLFALDNTSSDVFSSPTLKIHVTFNCNLDPNPAVVKLETLTLNKYAQDSSIDLNNPIDSVSTESTEVLNFPGCKAESGSETLEVPLDLYIIPQDFAILRIRGVDPKYLTDLKFFVTEKEVPIAFINSDVLDESHYKILYALPNPSKELTNYSTEVKKDFLVNIKTKTTYQGFDLSDPINQLIKAGALRNPFIIWTNQPNEIIQSAD